MQRLQEKNKLLTISKIYFNLSTAYVSFINKKGNGIKIKAGASKRIRNQKEKKKLQPERGQFCPLCP